MIEWAKVLNRAHLSLEHVKAERRPSGLRIKVADRNRLARADAGGKVVFFVTYG